MTAHRKETHMPRKKKQSPKTISSVKFNKESTTTCNLRLNKRTDADIILKLNEVPSKMGYIKALIRADIIANGFKNDDE